MPCNHGDSDADDTTLYRRSDGKWRVLVICRVCNADWWEDAG